MSSLLIISTVSSYEYYIPNEINDCTNSSRYILPSPFKSTAINKRLSSSRSFSGNLEAKYINVAFLRFAASINFLIFSKASGAIDVSRLLSMFYIIGWLQASSAENLAFMSFTSSLLIRSFAKLETFLNASWSKVQVPNKTFSIISLCDSPGKGTFPESRI